MPAKKEKNPEDDASLVRAGYRYALALTHNVHDAEDLVQEAWLKWSAARDRGAAPGYEDGERARAYFLTIVRNVFVDSHRQGRRMSIESLGARQENLAAKTESEGEGDTYQASAEDVRHALGRLGPGEREALFLSAYEGLTAAQIAERTNTSRGTILSRLQRGREKLARLLGKDSRDAERGVL